MKTTFSKDHPTDSEQFPIGIYFKLDSRFYMISERNDRD